jgi:hypothetical protein
MITHKRISVLKGLVFSAGLFAWVMTGLLACNELDDGYATNPSRRLGFSADTLSFDTVFVTIGSVTRHLMVYNTNKEALNIESVRLLNATSQGFRLNVDGRKGESFSNIRIAGKDSLYVFVEVTVDPTGENQPLLMEDLLEFTVNGVKQTVVLQAYGQDVHLFKRGFVITRDTLWPADKPYLIYDSLVIEAGSTLSLEPGAVLCMHDKAKWVVNGTLIPAGTLDKPVVFRGDRLDKLLTDLPYDRIPNQWDGIYFGAESFGNVMDYVIVRNGQKGLWLAASAPDSLKLRLSCSQLTNMGESVLTAVNCRIEAVNTEFSNASRSVVSLTGGIYHFIHCTLANHYIKIAFSNRKGEPTLSLSNYTSDNQGVKSSFPLQQARFDNCIIDGNFPPGNKPLQGEIGLDSLEEVAFGFFFNHCAVKTRETEDPAFASVEFIRDDYAPQYKSLGDLTNGYLFDFRLDIAKDKDGNPEGKQVAIGKADPAIAAQYPLDRLGIDRVASDDGPDMGAYEYVPEPETELQL